MDGYDDTMWREASQPQVSEPLLSMLTLILPDFGYFFYFLGILFGSRSISDKIRNERHKELPQFQMRVNFKSRIHIWNYGFK